MNRIMLVIIGWFTILFSLLLLWVTSPLGRATMARTGLGFPDKQPRDLAFLIVALFVLGFVIIFGTAVDSMVSGLVRAVTGSSKGALEGASLNTDENDIPFGHVFFYGGALYLLIAAAFGASIILFGSSSQGMDFSRFSDLRFLQFLAVWPYHVMAVIGPFDLTLQDFY